MSHESEHKSGGYYGKGHGQHSNMPKEVVMKDYPHKGGLMGEYNDTMEGIDAAHGAAHKKLEKNLGKSKF